MSKIVDVHIFSPGTQTSAQGVTREFTKQDLKQVVESYDAGLHEAPIVIGHEMNDKVPSWGWVKGVKMKGTDLFAEVEFTPQMGGFINDGLYKKVSASFYSPESKINPEPGKWSLRHVAMLGGQPPAVKGLQGFAYSELEDGVVDFATGVDVKLNPESVFDDELGPTLKEDQSPLAQLKTTLDEARTEMAKEEQIKAEAEETLQEVQQEVEADGQEEFAEETKKAPKGKMGAEDADEEVSEDEADEAEEKSSKKPKNFKEDEAKHAEKKMDPVGKADGDIDNDGDEDSSDEYLKKRRAAIKAKMKDDKSDNAEKDSVDHKSGCSSAKEYMEKYDEAKHGDMKKYMEKYEGDTADMKKYMEDSKYSDKKMSYSEVEVPEGFDIAEYREGFTQAVLAFKEAALIGGEVEFTEDDEVTPSFKAGVEAGLEFGEAEVLRDGKATAAGDGKHNEKCCDTDEESDGEGPVASKVKKQSKDGECCETDAGEFEEPTFDPSNDKGSKKKRGTDNLNSSDVGVKETRSFAEPKVKAVMPNVSQNDPNGRGEVGKADESGKTGRSTTGKDDDHNREKTGKDGGASDKDRSDKGADSGAQEADRKKTGTGDEEDRGLVNAAGGGAPGSGKQIKSPSVRVMRVGKKADAKPAASNFAESEQFSELSARLAELEAANARLVQEKFAAEQAAHRMQLEEFAESLYATGRLTGAIVDQTDLVDYMEGLEYGTLEFAEGESAATPLMELLAALPSQVSFAEVAAHNKDAVPFENLDPHEKALRLSEEEGIEYSEALKKTLFTAE